LCFPTLGAKTKARQGWGTQVSVVDAAFGYRPPPMAIG
jgi:hypothetical protein